MEEHMTSDNLPAVQPAGDDGFDTAARAAASRLTGSIRRRIGAAVLNGDRQPIEMPAERLVTGISMCATRWVDNMPQRRPITDLDDVVGDETAELLLHCVDNATARQECWILKSLGDLREACDFAASVTNMRRVRGPDVLAIARIEISAWSTSFGDKPKLKITPIQWVERNDPTPSLTVVAADPAPDPVADPAPVTDPPDPPLWSTRRHQAAYEHLKPVTPAIEPLTIEIDEIPF
jgi:hypothetical protein